MLKLYNTFSGKKTTFIPREKNKVRLYVCGPTVYDYIHLGNTRTYTIFDILARYLRWKGYKVFYLQNISDIGRKIVRRAKELRTTPKRLTDKFENAYYDDARAMGLKSVDKFVRASSSMHISIQQIHSLLAAGLAYKSEGGVCFNTSRFKFLGLSKKVSKKFNRLGDFVLWSTLKEAGCLLPSPFGKGTPGWHIQDTSIGEKHFGYEYDVHGGGLDALYPHHAAKYSILESLANNHPAVKYWLHVNLVKNKGQKMSKSLNNCMPVRKIISKFPPGAVRLFLISKHYRQPLDYTQKNLEIANATYQNILNFLIKLKKIRRNKYKHNITKLISETKNKFILDVDDDLNTAAAIKTILRFMVRVNGPIGRKQLDYTNAQKALATMYWFDDVLGLNIIGGT